MEANKKKWFPGMAGSKVNIKVESTDADIIIKYPLAPTEFDIQYRLYSDIEFLCQQLDNGSEVKSEVTVYMDDTIRCRFDIMIFKNGQAVCAIEVKKSKYLSANQDQDEKQITKYKMFQRCAGVPVLWCKGMDEIDKTVEAIKKHIT